MIEENQYNCVSVLWMDKIMDRGCRRLFQMIEPVFFC